MMTICCWLTEDMLEQEDDCFHIWLLVSKRIFERIVLKWSDKHLFRLGKQLSVLLDLLPLFLLFFVPQLVVKHVKQSFIIQYSPWLVELSQVLDHDVCV